jgi:hypothetical protein
MVIVMQKLTSVIGACVLVGALFSGNNPKAIAQSCNFFAGTAVGGQKVNLNICSISRVNYRSVDFVYYLGDQEFASQANCQNGTWTTFPDRRVHRPQSPATQRMLNVVCNYR